MPVGTGGHKKLMSRVELLEYDRRPGLLEKPIEFKKLRGNIDTEILLADIPAGRQA